MTKAQSLARLDTLLSDMKQPTASEVALSEFIKNAMSTLKTKN